MSDTKTAAAPPDAMAGTLAAFDEGAKLLERAYRELWAIRESERAQAGLLASERVRDLCHELHNPLGGVRGLATLLQRELETTASPKARRLLERIEDGLRSMDSALRRATADDGERSDAGAIAEETAALALAANRADGGDVRFGVDAAEGIELPVSAGPFRDVLANLVRNAAESCEPGGQVRIRLESGLDRVIAWVEDDGRGLPLIPDEVLFRRGFSTKGSGRGRGLAIAGELVERSGGTLTLCRLARGCIARVCLPRR